MQRTTQAALPQQAASKREWQFPVFLREQRQIGGEGALRPPYKHPTPTRRQSRRLPRTAQRSGGAVIDSVLDRSDGCSRYSSSAV
jgi:hypothetical protein